MSTKTNTSTSNQYAPAGMAAYNSLVPQVSTNLTNLMSSPLNNSFFQNQLAQSQGAASQIGQRNIANIASNTRASGGLLSGATGFNTASLNNAMLSNSANQSGAFNSSLNSALQSRNFALSSAQNFNPLQTGANTTQSKSGLGTWLPQVAGAALGAATGGASTMATNALNQTMQQQQALQQYNQQPWTPGSNTSNPLASSSNSVGQTPWTA